MNIMSKKATKLTPLSKNQLETLTLIVKYDDMAQVADQLGITRTALNSRMQVIRNRRQVAQNVVNQLNVYMRASKILARRLRYE